MYKGSSLYDEGSLNVTKGITDRFSYMQMLWLFQRALCSKHLIQRLCSNTNYRVAPSADELLAGGDIGTEGVLID